jgi:ABC-type nitrate/sulfonate/bicarbonate transport system substrate-binding protein
VKSTPSISVAVLTLAIAMSIGVWIGYFGRPGFPHPPRILGDTAPFVRSQVFGAVPLWIEIGYQPLVIPAAHLIEVMRRDLILASYMESNRVRLRFVQFAEGGSCIQAFDKGLDGAVLPGIGAVRLAVRHAAHIVSRFQSGYVSIICRGARTLDDLKGRRVGYRLGDGVLQALRSSFRKVGIDPSDVAFVELSDNDPTKGLLLGRADAIGAFEPIPTIAARNFPELAILGQEIGRAHV